MSEAREQRWHKRLEDGVVFPMNAHTVGKHGFLECTKDGDILDTQPSAKVKTTTVIPEQVADTALGAEIQGLQTQVRVLTEQLADARVKLRDTESERDLAQAERTALAARLHKLGVDEEEAVESPPIVADEDEVFDVDNANFNIDLALDMLPEDNDEAIALMVNMAEQRYGKILDTRKARGAMIKDLRDFEGKHKGG